MVLQQRSLLHQFNAHTNNGENRSRGEETFVKVSPLWQLLRYEAENIFFEMKCGRMLSMGDGRLIK